jgi:hypothetical protein
MGARKYRWLIPSITAALLKQEASQKPENESVIKMANMY